MPPRRLTLIRHSISEIRPAVPAAEWRLSPDGLARARAFASEIDPGTADRVFTSTEPKAVQTAHAIADLWMLPVEEIARLREHERPAARILPREQFESTVRDMFARPSELVFGAETADAARARFTGALMQLVAQTDRDLIVVSHATVIALFVSAHAGIDAFEFWKQLTMPCAVAFGLPAFGLEGLTLPR